MKKNLWVVFVVFLIGGMVFPGSITVTYPKANDTLTVGKTYDITFVVNGCESGDIKINIFKNSIDQANFVLQLTENNSDGKVSWKIPVNFETGDYILRVKAENTCIGDSGVFKISKMTVLPGDHTLEVKKKFTAAPGVHLVAKKPEITQVSSTPTGTLKPGSRVYVKGVDFGPDKGQILMKGAFPGGVVGLEKVTWINHLTAQGYIPDYLNGYPSQEVEILIVSSGGTVSDPYKWKLKFTGREEKVLMSDAVGVICGLDGNSNICNKTWTSDTGYTMAMPVEHAISGYHSNAWGAVGDDVGDDIYTIDLKNGWVLKSIQVVKWEKSSDGEVLSGPTPAFPEGSSTWTATIHWLVTPNDSVRYELKIIVEGPIGTNYK